MINDDIDNLIISDHLDEVDTFINVAMVCKKFLLWSLNPKALSRILKLELARIDFVIEEYSNSISEFQKKIYNMHILRPEIYNKMRRKASLPKFFYNSLPVHLTPFKFNISTLVTPLNNCCYTGGLLCQKVYGKEWECDTDVWSRVEQKDNSCFMNSLSTLDITIKDFKPYRCISGFDLSICMQGIVIEDRKKTMHITPLALFTYYTKIVVVTTCYRTISYTDQYQSYGRNRSPFDYYIAHVKYLKNGPRPHHNQHGKDFSNCKSCKMGLINKEMITWKDRVCKYQERFPDFTFVYVTTTT